MWKKHGSALLGLILTIALFITGIKLPEYVAAAGSDKTSLVAGKDSTTFVLSQKDSGGSYYPITDTTKELMKLRLHLLFQSLIPNLNSKSVMLYLQRILLQDISQLSLIFQIQMMQYLR